MGKDNVLAAGTPMTGETPWNGEDIYVEYGDKVLLITGGTGDALDGDDIEQGYTDYFNLELYQKESFSFGKIGSMDTVGGGFMLRTESILDEFGGHPVKEIVEAVFIENGEEDEFNLKASGIPDYVVLSE